MTFTAAPSLVGAAYQGLTSRQVQKRTSPIKNTKNSYSLGIVYTRLLRFPYSHSIVPGGLLVKSYATRLIPRTSLTILLATLPRNAGSNG